MLHTGLNHQIADLPNPQSPYKKDNPKTWGDGVLIDFGDGTAGVAKKVAFSNNGTYTVNRLCGNPGTGKKIGDVISWGGAVSAISANDNGYSYDLNRLGPNVLEILIVANSSTNQDVNLLQNNNLIVNYGPYGGVEIKYIWVWCIVEYN